MVSGLFIGGEWTAGGPPIEVRNKYDGTVYAALASARPEDVDAAIAAAVRAAPEMARMPAWRRGEILARASEGIRARREELARIIATEAGKALKFARVEVDRAVQTFAVAAEEAKRLHGETIPLDAAPAGEGYFGFWQRRPIGVVVAIAPFNFPLNLVAHKVAPALAAGNAVVLKPATSTPLSSVALCEILHAAGLPPGALNLVVGSGATVGDRLVADPRVGKVTFTGSAPVGRHILARAGIKKVTLELGNASPVIVASDADLDLVAKRCALGAFYNSGQVCLSVQRVYGDRRIAEPFLEKFAQATEAMVVGDPLDERVDVGPMIDLKEAARAETWVDEAVSEGARVVAGGRREGAVYWPTLLDHVRPGMKVIDQEVFAPVASFVPYDDFEEALAAANASDYGLQASVFTRDINRVLSAIRTLDFGGVIINDTPTFRVDHMPYGGMRQSGIGREGVRFAMEEMTNIQVVAIRG
ncbi:MAG: aldehyde dehydrogenase family protein [Pseudomonadota bacterium]|nr:aldehyde dehydrogenase family protein [Pseudomonadota bacterium]